MPNGGSNCCGECVCNKAVREMSYPYTDESNRFWDLSFCTLRQINITDPFWTYCHNWFPSGSDRDISEILSQEPIGLISKSGLYEGYVKIPWHGSIEPNVSVPCTCVTCDRTTESGITIEVVDKVLGDRITESGTTIKLVYKVLGFCTNLHYVEWWKTKHPDSDIDTSYFATPEEYYTID